MTSEKIADKSVTNPKLADQAVDARALKTGAVTADAIASGAVTAAAIADNSVSSAAIANGSVGTSELAAKAVTTGTIDDKAVTTPKINDGAVTAAKLDPNAAVLGLNGLTGGVSLAGGQNIAVGKNGNMITVGLSGPVDATTLGGLSPAVFARRMPNVITVAPSNADFTTISAALNAITDASASKRYVVAVAPGTYSEKVQLKQFVSVVGAGTAATIIFASGGNTAATAATVTAVDNSELSNVTIQSAGNISSIGVYADNANAVLRNVSIVANNGSSTSYGVYATNSSALKMSGVKVDVSQSNAVYGLHADWSAEIRCDSCDIGVSNVSNDYALHETGATIKVGASLIRGPISGDGAIHCPASFDENYTAKTGC